MAVCPVNALLLQPHIHSMLTHTHKAAHFVIFPQFQQQTRATQSSLGLQGCCCDRQWIFCSPNAHHISGRVMACWRPVSLTVPASGNGGQHGPDTLLWEVLL